MIFPYVAAYFTPSKEMFDERFVKDYKERMILICNKKRIGFYQLTPEEDCLNVTGIFLIPEYWGKGIGKYMMQYFEGLGFKSIRLQVWENNPAHNFYKKIGYSDISKKNHKYQMEKILKE